MLRAYSVPAYPFGIDRVLPSGDTVTLYLHGNERFHWYTLSDGSWVEFDSDGGLVLVDSLSESEISDRMRSRRTLDATESAYPINKAPRGLIIMVNFSDIQFQSSNTRSAIDEMHNGSNYTYNGATGSSGQYFSEQSYGAYTPHFDVVGPVELPRDCSYYGEDLSSSVIDIRADSMVVQACRIADGSPWNVDFSRYDNDGDGEIDFVFILYAGYNEAEGGNEETLWPHSSEIYNEWHVDKRFDGKRVNKYACSSELRLNKGSERAGIATFCHEFSHVLGLPDLYETYSSKVSHKTLGYWDIMDYGPYNNNGNTPPAYSAYERFFLGWLTPYILNSPCSVKLDELNSSGASCIVTTTGTHNLSGNNPNPLTFYTIENRQLMGWDKYIPGAGMLLERIHYSYYTWRMNRVNNDESDMGVDLIEADGLTTKGMAGKATDAFPAGGDSYSPFEHYPITNISMSDGVIYFDFMGGGELIDISSVTCAEATLSDEDVEIMGIYSITGERMGVSDVGALGSGIYLIQSNKGCKKIFIR